MRGITKNVFQDGVINRKELIKVRGTVKAEVLKGEPKFPALVATSVYDTKTVHLLSMTCKI